MRLSTVKHLQKTRSDAMKLLPSEPGVYALCDIDKVPIYVGKTTDLHDRIPRHLTSARSDVIANRHLDLWEISEIWYWPASDHPTYTLGDLEKNIINYFHDRSPLSIGKVPRKPASYSTFVLSAPKKIHVLEKREIEIRSDVQIRLMRQLDQLKEIFSYTLEVKNNHDQRRMLRFHFNRVKKYYENFMTSQGDEA